MPRAIKSPATRAFITGKKTRSNLKFLNTSLLLPWNACELPAAHPVYWSSLSTIFWQHPSLDFPLPRAVDSPTHSIFLDSSPRYRPSTVASNLLAYASGAYLQSWPFYYKFPCTPASFFLRAMHYANSLFFLPTFVNVSITFFAIFFSRVQNRTQMWVCNEAKSPTRKQ